MKADDHRLPEAARIDPSTQEMHETKRDSDALSKAMKDCIAAEQMPTTP
jgi:hypothetical protein